MPRKSALAAMIAVLLIASVAVPGLVSAEEHTLGVEAVQSPTNGDVTVTVTEEDSEVENATVNVSSSEAYAGNGTYETNANGSIHLPNPNETVDVWVNVTADNRSVERQFTLIPYEDSLDVTITQERTTDPVLVEVSQYDTLVENATVEVSANDSYAGTGTYETDENGSVSLSVPNETVTVNVTATADNLTATETSVLEAPSLGVSVNQDAHQRVHIDVTYGEEPTDGANVTVSGNYSEAGSYVTDEDGSVTLPAPDNNTTITVTANYQNESKTVTENITSVAETNQTKPFGLRLVRYINELQAQEEAVHMGSEISTFVHNNNPSAANDDAGPPEHAGPESAGPPDHAGEEADEMEDMSENDEQEEEEENDDEKEESEEADIDDEESEDEYAENEESDDNRNGSPGPPDHARSSDDGNDEPSADEDSPDKAGQGPPPHANND